MFDARICSEFEKRVEKSISPYTYIVIYARLMLLSAVDFG